ncbi:MAG: chemotaxis protein CheW [Verrucomicrobiota bacterium]
MIFLLCQIGNDRYALEIRHVVEVLPRVHLKQIPQAARGIAGVFNYHGEPVPVVDLAAMALDLPARASLCTRLLVVQYPVAEGRTGLLGLLAEHATDTLRREPSDFQPPEVSPPQAPYLGPVTSDERGLIQWLKLEQILPPSVRDQLWQQAATAQEQPTTSIAGKVEGLKR